MLLAPLELGFCVFFHALASIILGLLLILVLFHEIFEHLILGLWGMLNNVNPCLALCSLASQLLSHVLPQLILLVGHFLGKFDARVGDFLGLASLVWCLQLLKSFLHPLFFFILLFEYFALLLQRIDVLDEQGVLDGPRLLLT